MSRKPWALLAICVAAGVGNGPGVEAAEPIPVVAIRVEGASGIDGVNLVRAQEIATDIYAQAGVALRWITDEAVPADRTLTIILTSIATAPRGISPESMGVAPSPGDGTRGATAYVFMDRVTSFAFKNKVAAEYVLACGMAHEIGHLLLPPNSHHAMGIMRGSWHAKLFPPHAPGVPSFPSEQARLLRLRVGSR